MAATTVTTVDYLVTKAIGKLKATDAVNRLLTLFDVAPVNRAVLQSALALDFDDYEDAVIHDAAIHAGLDGIVTRDVAGFRKASLPVYQPDEVLHVLATRNGHDNDD